MEGLAHLLLRATIVSFERAIEQSRVVIRRVKAVLDLVAEDLLLLELADHEHLDSHLPLGLLYLPERLNLRFLCHDVCLGIQLSNDIYFIFFHGITLIPSSCQFLQG